MPRPRLHGGRRALLLAVATVAIVLQALAPFSHGSRSILDLASGGDRFAGASGSMPGGGIPLIPNAQPPAPAAPSSSDAPSPAAPPSVAPVEALPPAQSPVAAVPIAALAGDGIPLTALDAYRRAAAAIDARSPQCKISWTLLAGIGRVESNHGRFGGAMLRADGSATVRIIGIRLDGTASARILDTDHGVLDGDTVYDRAVGPMQFIPSTWAIYGADDNGDGRRDPFNIYDATLAAAGYLCAAGGDLSTEAGRIRAVLAYNHSDSYVAEVLALALAYANGGVVVGPPGFPGMIPPVNNAMPPVDPGVPAAIAQELVRHSTKSASRPRPTATRTLSAAPVSTASSSTPSGSPSPTVSATGSTSATGVTTSASPTGSEPATGSASPTATATSTASTPAHNPSSTSAKCPSNAPSSSPSPAGSESGATPTPEKPKPTSTPTTTTEPTPTTSAPASTTTASPPEECK